MRWFISLFLTLVAGALCAAGPDRAAEDFFESKVRPVLADHCFKCHGDKKQSGGLRLDNRAAIMKGGDNGPALIPANAAKSLIARAVRHDGELKMPPTGKLPDDKIAAIDEWIRSGANWPESGASPKAETSSSHWAFRPVSVPNFPSVRERDWVTNPVDVFVKANLERLDIAPNPRAEKAVLIRRLTFDLHGLPPSAKDVAAFVADESPNAYEKLVDRLLASPRYGERWGRHWLDIARYSDTKGYFFEGERRYPFAYTYRDYVIRAFNVDMPYNQFVIEQIAVDRLPHVTDKRSLAALGFLTVGRRFLNNIDDIIDDRLDVVSRGFMGLTLTCARCHDHKFDPIPIQDYYSLHGVFASTDEPAELPVIDESARVAAYKQFEQELSKREAAANSAAQSRLDAVVKATRATSLIPGTQMPALSALVGLSPNSNVRADRLKVLKQLRPSEARELKLLIAKIDEWRAMAPPAPDRAMIVADKPKPVAAQVYERGNPANRGTIVPRQFLALLSGPDRKPFTQGSGRLELARAIADQNNPLTARVMVNRIWAHHFGRGLVATPSDFGLRSDPPSHPELLDYLADRFVRDGWSIKNLHRLMLTSSTYRQSSADRPELAAADPENRMLAKYNRRRLDLESLRDGMLATAGLIDYQPGGPSVELTKQPFNHRRTVYGYIERQNLPGMFRNFDFANPDTHSPQRFATTVPQQALFLMNGQFGVHVAKSLAARPNVVSAEYDEERIAALYHAVFARTPTDEEVRLGVAFVHDARPIAGLTRWEQYAQVLLLSNEFAFVD